MTLAGFVLVAIGLHWRRTIPDTEQDFTDYPGRWRLVRLPACLLWWDNTIDGMLGDKRGWWDNHMREAGIESGAESVVSMWMWAAVRNACNYWKRFVVSVPIDECSIVKLAGNSEEVNSNGHVALCGGDAMRRAWIFLVATHRATGRRWYSFRAVIPYFPPMDGADGRGFVVQVGWAFHQRHMFEDFSGEREYKRWKGFECRINPYGRID
jgi:hypothetical protein